MTAGCPGGGASQPKPLEEVIQNFTAAAILDILVTGEMGWFGPIAAGVGYLSYNLTDLCTKDPPAMPTLSAQRLYEYTLTGQGAQFLREDATALLANYLWNQYCECVGGAALPPFIPLPAPDGYQNNDPRLDKPPGTPCGGQISVFESKTFDASGNITWDWQLPPNVVAGAQWIKFTENGGVATTPSPYPVTNTLQWLATGGTQVVGEQTWSTAGLIPASTPVTHSYAVPTNAATYRLTTHTGSAPNTSFGIEIHLNHYCTPLPPSLEQPCCPPDPTLENLIIQVLRLEQLILDSLGGTFGYTKGTVHPNLTGSGSLTVTSLRGVLVDVTQGTPTNPELEGVPPYEWNLGWISLLTGDGFVDEKRLTRQHQVWQPQLMPGATTVGYFLHPGVTATLTELHPSS